MKIDRTRKSIIWDFRSVNLLISSAGISQVITFATTVLIARLYTPEQFATYSLVIACATVLTQFLILSMDTFIVPASSEEIAVGLIQKSLIYLRRHTITCLVIILMYSVQSFIITPHALGNAKYGMAILILANIAGIYSLLSQYLLRFEQFKTLAFRGPIQNSSIGISQVFFKTIGLGSSGLIIGEMLGRIIGVAYLVRKFNSKHLFTKQRNFHYTTEHSKRVFTVNFLTIMLELLAVSFLLFFIVGSFGHEAGGQVAMAQRVIGLPVVLVGAAISQYILAKSANSSRRGDILTRSEMSKILINLFALGVSISVIIYALGPLTLKGILGLQWDTAGYLLQTIAPIFVVSFIWNPVSSIFYVRKKWTEFFGITLLRIILVAVGGSLSWLLEFDLVESTFTVIFCGAVAQSIGIMYIYIDSPKSQNN